MSSESFYRFLNAFRVVLQPLFGGHFNFMLGIGQKFTRFECDRFELPEVLKLKDCELRNERHFIEFLIRNDWIQRDLGIKMYPSNGFFPDIIGEIYDAKGGVIKVEAEYRAENYTMHGHAFRGCDLILSFFRRPNVHIIKGIPVWSFYEWKYGSEYADLCLHNDMNFDFDKWSEKVEMDDSAIDMDDWLYKNLIKEWKVKYRQRLKTKELMGKHLKELESKPSGLVSHSAKIEALKDLLESMSVRKH